MPASVHEEVRTTWRSTFARLDNVLYHPCPRRVLTRTSSDSARLRVEY